MHPAQKTKLGKYQSNEANVNVLNFETSANNRQRLHNQTIRSVILKLARGRLEGLQSPLYFRMIYIIKKELHAKYKLLSFKRALKMLKNDTCIIKIRQAILEI